MDICRDCIWSRQGGQFCVNPAVITDYEGMALSMLTEGQVMTDCLRRVEEPDCKGYCEKPYRPDPGMPHGIITLDKGEKLTWIDNDGRPAVIEPMRDCLGVEESFYRAGFWFAAVVIGVLLVVIWRVA